MSAGVQITAISLTSPDQRRGREWAIRSYRGGGGPRSTGRLAACMSTAATLSPRRDGEMGGGLSAADVGGSTTPAPAPAGADASASTSAGGPDAGRAGG